PLPGRRGRGGPGGDAHGGGRRGHLGDGPQRPGLRTRLAGPHRSPVGGVAMTGETPAQESLMGALEQLSSEVGVPLDELRRTVEEALTAAYRRAFEPTGEVTVRLQPETGEMTAIESTVGPDGETVEQALPVDEFKRMAAQTART